MQHRYSITNNIWPWFTSLWNLLLIFIPFFSLHIYPMTTANSDIAEISSQHSLSHSPLHNAYLVERISSFKLPKSSSCKTHTPWWSTFSLQAVLCLILRLRNVCRHTQRVLMHTFIISWCNCLESYNSCSVRIRLCAVIVTMWRTVVPNITKCQSIGRKAGWFPSIAFCTPGFFLTKYINSHKNH